jgi:hypothetical protein
VPGTDTGDPLQAHVQDRCSCQVQRPAAATPCSSTSPIATIPGSRPPRQSAEPVRCSVPAAAGLTSLPRQSRPCGIVAGLYCSPPKLPPLREPRPSPSRDRATVWLAEYMVARGPVISTEVIADATATGINPYRAPRAESGMAWVSSSSSSATITWIIVAPDPHFGHVLGTDISNHSQK